MKSGEYKVSSSSPLLAGEYAMVLRPVSKNNNFPAETWHEGKGVGCCSTRHSRFRYRPLQSVN